MKVENSQIPDRPQRPLEACVRILVCHWSVSRGMISVQASAQYYTENLQRRHHPRKTRVLSNHFILL